MFISANSNLLLILYSKKYLAMCFFNLQKCQNHKFQIQTVFTIPSLHNPCIGHPVRIVHFVWRAHIRAIAILISGKWLREITWNLDKMNRIPWGHLTGMDAIKCFISQPLKPFKDLTNYTLWIVPVFLKTIQTHLITSDYRTALFSKELSQLC